MKVLLFALFGLLVAGATALPKQDVDIEIRGNRFDENIIRGLIEAYQAWIRNNNLDPWIVDRADHEFDVGVYTQIHVIVDHLYLEGLSNININKLEYSILFGKLTFDLEMPELILAVGDAEVYVNRYGQSHNAQFRGNSSFKKIRLAGEAYLASSIYGISVSSLELQFSIGDIQTDYTLVYQGVDFSDDLNVLFNEIIPTFMEANEGEINKLLSDRAKAAINWYLGNR